MQHLALVSLVLFTGAGQRRNCCPTPLATPCGSAMTYSTPAGYTSCSGMSVMYSNPYAQSCGVVAMPMNCCAPAVAATPAAAPALAQTTDASTLQAVAAAEGEQDLPLTLHEELDVGNVVAADEVDGIAAPGGQFASGFVGGYGGFGGGGISGGGRSVGSLGGGSGGGTGGGGTPFISTDDDPDPIPDDPTKNPPKDPPPQVPLPATAWMGLIGCAAAFVAVKRGMIG